MFRLANFQIGGSLRVVTTLIWGRACTGFQPSSQTAKRILMAWMAFPFYLLLSRVPTWMQYSARQVRAVFVLHTFCMWVAIFWVLPSALAGLLCLAGCWGSRILPCTVFFCIRFWKISHVVLSLVPWRASRFVATWRTARLISRIFFFRKNVSSTLPCVLTREAQTALNQ
jgi:hypothetical protein